MNCYIVDYKLPEEGIKSYLVLEADSLQEAYGLLLDWLKDKPAFVSLEFKIIGDNNSPFTVLRKHETS